jgi:hypothetical protein
MLGKLGSLLGTGKCSSVAVFAAGFHIYGTPASDLCRFF